jgi:hypothetical protein
MERARSIAAESNLPTYLWSEAVSMANFLINRSPTRSNFGVPPETTFTGKPLDLSKLKIFGCIAYIHVPDEDRKKMDSKTIKGMFVGYDMESKAYRIYDPLRRKVIISRDVVFDESKVGFHHLTTPQPNNSPSLTTIISLNNCNSAPSPTTSINLDFLDSPTQSRTPSSSDGITGDHTNDDTHQTITRSTTSAATSPSHDRSHTWDQGRAPQISPTRLPHIPDPDRAISIPCDLGVNHDTSQPMSTSTPMTDTTASTSTTEQSSHSGKRYPTRTRAPSSRLKNFWTLAVSEESEPSSYQEAIANPGWQAAIQSEVNSILKNETWEVIDRPTNRSPITSKWLFKIKKCGDNMKQKARIVARGFQQREGVDYQDIFAPVVRWSTIRTIVALAAKNNWPIHQLDVCTAFLNGTLNEDVVMEIPEGFPYAGNPLKACRVKRALYGLKQSPKAWYSRIDAWLISQGLTRSEYDPNLYFSTRNGKRTFILLYVDDLLITGDDSERIANLKDALKREFEMTDLGAANVYLGAEIRRCARGILLTQTSYIHKLLAKYGLTNCNPSQLPMDPNLTLQRQMNSEAVDTELYRSMVGSLIYVTNTRPDICYAVSTVARYMDSPQTPHLQAAKRILRYLQGTADFGLFFSSDNSEQFHTYTDADWGRDIDTRRSTSGILHKLGTASIFWTSKLQPTVSLSSTEAEYRVLTDASKDIIYFRKLLEEIGINIDQPTNILTDNQSSIKLVDNPVMHTRTKHIGIQAHFIREAAQAGHVQVTFTPTALQQADFLTKPLNFNKFCINRDSVGVLSLSTHLTTDNST